MDESSQILVTELRQQNEGLSQRIELMEGHLSQLVAMVKDLHEKLPSVDDGLDTTANSVEGEDDKA